MNPCHAKGQERQDGCTRVVLPRNFCSSCSIGAYNATGHYLNCLQVTDLKSNPQCILNFQNYVNLNPCDHRRALALNMYQDADPATRERGRRMLDYFHYAICENGCDCLPQMNANPTNRTMDVTRGNCQAHLFYDVCAVLPDIRVVQLEGTAFINPANFPSVCPIVRKWISTADGQSFRDVLNTTVDSQVRVFLNMLFRAEQMPYSPWYMQCYGLETAQRRIGAYQGLPYLPSFPIRINAGRLRGGFIDTSGHIWLNDRFITQGDKVLDMDITKPVATTLDDVLYRTARSSFHDYVLYRIPVTPGTYKVTLGFAEIGYRRIGKRIFNVIVEGTMVRKDLDIVAVAGRWRKPIQLETTVTVKDNFLNVYLDPVKGNPIISWIEVDQVMQ